MRQMINVWKQVLILVVVFSVVAVMWILTHPEIPPIIKPQDQILEELHDSYKPYITPHNYNVSNISKNLFPNNFTDVSLSYLQDWMVTNYDRIGDYKQKLPIQTIQDGAGNHISLHLLQYSIILNKIPDNKTYLLLIELKYSGDKTPRNHSATLTIFDDKLFISDLTIPKKDLSYSCKLSTPVECLFNILTNNYITEYNVKYALNQTKAVSFNNNQEFESWLESQKI